MDDKIWWEGENEIISKTKEINEVFEEIEFLFSEIEFYFNKDEGKGFYKLIESFDAIKLNNWLVVIQKNIYVKSNRDEFNKILDNCWEILKKIKEFDIEIRKELLGIMVKTLSFTDIEVEGKDEVIRDWPNEFRCYVQHFQKIFDVELLKKYFDSKDLIKFEAEFHPYTDLYFHFTIILEDFINVIKCISNLVTNYFSSDGSLLLTVQQINPYPLIFKDYPAFVFFESLFSSSMFLKECGDISFVYRKMKEEGLIVSPKSSSFLDWVNFHFGLKISILKYIKNIKAAGRNSIYKNAYDSFY